MKAKEKTQYAALEITGSHISEPGQKTIRDFIEKEIISVEIFPSSIPDISKINIHLPESKLALYPGYWIVKDPRNRKIEVYTPAEFKSNYELIP